VPLKLRPLLTTPPPSRGAQVFRRPVVVIQPVVSGTALIVNTAPKACRENSASPRAALLDTALWWDGHPRVELDTEWPHSAAHPSKWRAQWRPAPHARAAEGAVITYSGWSRRCRTLMSPSACRGCEAGVLGHAR